MALHMPRLATGLSEEERARRKAIRDAAKAKQQAHFAANASVSAFARKDRSQAKQEAQAVKTQAKQVKAQSLQKQLIQCEVAPAVSNAAPATPSGLLPVNASAQAALPAQSKTTLNFVFSGSRGDVSRAKAALDPKATSRDWFCPDSNSLDPCRRPRIHSDGQGAGNILRKGSRFAFHPGVSLKHDVWMFQDRGGFYKRGERPSARSNSCR